MNKKDIISKETMDKEGVVNKKENKNKEDLQNNKETADNRDITNKKETMNNQNIINKKETVPKENIITVKNLIKTYDQGGIVALNGIDLEIKRGEFVSLMGPSGSGKSTLLNILGTLDQADEGSINVAGFDLTENKDFSFFRSQEIGFIFQLHNLIPNLTVSENVQIPMLQTEASDEEMVQRAAHLLKSVNLQNRLDQIPTKLSGGERQRVAIARALVNHPSIILADEPTGALDSKTGDIILKLLREIHRKENVTLILVTHEEYVARMADRTINLFDGRIT